MNIFSKRLPDFEVFDKITMEVIPRYKQSGLSGDEWRQHVKITFLFKGEEIHSFGTNSMESACLMLGAELITNTSPIPDKVIKAEDKKCFQPSCCNDATRTFFIKQLYSDRGEKLDVEDTGGLTYLRKFCEKHSIRGDCSREDSDDNYQEGK